MTSLTLTVVFMLCIPMNNGESNNLCTPKTQTCISAYKLLPAKNNMFDKNMINDTVCGKLGNYPNCFENCFKTSFFRNYYNASYSIMRDMCHVGVHNLNLTCFADIDADYSLCSDGITKALTNFRPGAMCRAIRDMVDCMLKPVVDTCGKTTVCFIRKMLPLYLKDVLAKIPQCDFPDPGSCVIPTTTITARPMLTTPRRSTKITMLTMRPTHWYMKSTTEIVVINPNEPTEQHHGTVESRASSIWIGPLLTLVTFTTVHFSY